MSTRDQSVIKLYQIAQQLDDIEATALRQGSNYDGLIILNKHVLTDLSDNYKQALNDLFGGGKFVIGQSDREQTQTEFNGVPVSPKPVDKVANEPVESGSAALQVMDGGIGEKPNDEVNSDLNLNTNEEPDDSSSDIDSAQASLDKFVADSMSNSGSSDSTSMSMAAPATSADSSLSASAAEDSEAMENDAADNDGSTEESSEDDTASAEKDTAAVDTVIDGSIASPQSDDESGDSNDDGTDLNLDTSAKDEDSTANSDANDDSNDDEESANPDLNLGSDNDDNLSTLLGSDSDSADNDSDADMDPSDMFANNGYN